jgi:hypothetical protein
MSRETFAGIRIWQNNPVDNERALTSCSPDEVREVLQQIVFPGLFNFFGKNTPGARSTELN